MGVLLVVILVIAVFYQIYKFDKIDKQQEELSRKKLYEETMSKINNKEQQETGLMVDEYVGKVYNLVKDRIGEDKCTFLHPYHDNSEIIEKLQSINKTLPLQTDFSTPEEIEQKLKTLDFNNITEYIDAKKSGDKGKNYFINADNQPCCTEEIAKEYFNSKGYIVIRAELDFWQMAFALLFFEEIYCKYWDVLSDIPFDYFYNSFYFMREDLINAKIEKIEKCNRLKYFVISQYNDFGKFQSRLFYPTGKNFNITILDNDIITRVFDIIPKEDIIKIMKRYAKNPSAYRSGMPDLIIFNDNNYQLIEVKRLKEKIRNEQADWISYMRENNIPVKILRVKGV